MSSSGVEDSDAAYARQLQDEEFSQAGFQPRQKSRSNSGNNEGEFEGANGNAARSSVGPSSAAAPAPPPSMAQAVAGPVMGVVARQPQHRQVQQNAADQARLVQEHSPTLLTLYILYGVIELSVAIGMLAKGSDSSCDRPLATWIGVYCARWVLLIPLAIARFRRRHRVFTVDNRDGLLQMQTWIKFAAFGQDQRDQHRRMQSTNTQ